MSDSALSNKFGNLPKIISSQAKRTKKKKCEGKDLKSKLLVDECIKSQWFKNNSW